MSDCKNIHYLDFCANYPDIAKHTVTWQITDDGHVIANLPYNEMVEYDSNSKTLRRIKKYEGNQTDWRREFSYRLTDLMNRKGIDQTYLSQAAGLSQASISNYINRKSSPSGYALASIAKVLECAVDYLTVFE